MDPIFEHSVFDSATEKVKRVMRQLEKPWKTLENTLYTCFKCGSNNVFSIAKQVRSADEGTSVFNNCRDCHNKHACFGFFKKFLATTNSSYVNASFSSCIILRSLLSFGCHTNMPLDCLLEYFGIAVYDCVSNHK